MPSDAPEPPPTIAYETPETRKSDERRSVLAWPSFYFLTFAIYLVIGLLLSQIVKHYLADAISKRAPLQVKAAIYFSPHLIGLSAGLLVATITVRRRINRQTTTEHEATDGR